MSQGIKTYKISFFAKVPDSDIKTMRRYFPKHLARAMNITCCWGLKIEEYVDDTTYTVYLYEEDSLATADLSTYDDKEEAIYFAAERGWDEVVNDKTGEVVWRNNYKGEV